MADVTDTQIDEQFAGDGQTQVEPGEVFDKAFQHYFAEGDPVSTKKLDEEQTNEEPGTDTEETEKPIDENTEATEENETSEPIEPEFKPYAFKGNVFNQEVEHTFDSPEELNKIISRGLGAETLYRKIKEKDTVIQSLQSDAESGKEFESFAKEDPSALLDLVIDKYMTEEQAASKVLELFKHYRNLASMTPEEREQHRKLKMADRLLQEKEASEKAAKEAEARQQELKREQQKVDDRNWANYELKRLSTKFQNLESEAIKQQILSVMNRVRLSRLEGKPVDYKQATQWLAQSMKPFEKLISPSETKRRLSDAITQKKQDSANTLQSAARQQINRQSPSKDEPKGPVDSGDLFDIIKQKVASGQATLRP